MLTNKIKKIVNSLTCCIFIINFMNCSQSQEQLYGTSEAFFTHKKFQGNYTATLPTRSVDSMVSRIKAEVPTPWQARACEQAYYAIPEELSDTFFFDFLDKCETAFRSDSLIAMTQFLRGRLYLQRVKFDSSEMCLQESYNLSIKRKDFVRASDAQFVLGDLYSNRGDYPAAFRMLTEAYNIACSMGANDEGRRYFTMRMLGAVYTSIGDYSKAMYWDKLTWDYSQSINNPMYQVRTSTSLADNYLKMGLVDSAQIWIDSSFFYRKKNKITYYFGATHTISAKIKTIKGYHKGAFEDLAIAKKDTAFLNYIGFLSFYNSSLGLVYFNTNKLDSAIICYTKALEHPDTLQKAEFHFQLAKIYEKKGDAYLALSHEREGHEMKNRILNVFKERSLARIEADTKIKEIEYEANTKRFRWIIGSLVSVVCLIISLYFISVYSKNQKILLQEKELIEVQERLKSKALQEAEASLIAKDEVLMFKEQQLDFKNTLIQELESKLTDSRQNLKDTDLPKMTSLRSIRILTNEDWVHFRELFDTHFPNFGILLKSKLPDLTVAEIRLFLLLKAGFEAHEIAHMQGISTSSVYTARYRLRRKLGLADDADLENFIVSI
jgi:tetratricopeptide (TPR) repeat protein